MSQAIIEPQQGLSVVVPEPSGAVVIHAPGITMIMPELIADAGEDAANATLEFFLARIPNPNTREAYGRAVARFCAWCSRENLALLEVSAVAVAAYLEQLNGELAPPSVKQHLAGLRHWLDWLTQRGALPINPASAVRGPKYIVNEGKTPVLEREGARRLFESIQGDDVVTLRDRALLAVMLFGFVRVSAAMKMCVKDFIDDPNGGTLAISEKGGKARRIPCHHRTREYIRAYLDAAMRANQGEASEPTPLDGKAPLFQSAPGWSQRLSGKRMRRHAALEMVKRRCIAAGLSQDFCNHSFRGTGITLHLENHGKLEDAQRLAGHADARTTRLYDRRASKELRDEVERVQI